MRRFMFRLVFLVTVAFLFLVWVKNDSRSEQEQRVKDVVIETADLTGDFIDDAVNKAKENGHTHHITIDFELPF